MADSDWVDAPEASGEWVDAPEPVSNRFDLFKELARPGAASRQAILGKSPEGPQFQTPEELAAFMQSQTPEQQRAQAQQMPNVIQRAAQGWQNPEQAPSFVNAIPSPDPSWPEPAKEAAMWAQAVGGSGADLLVDPTMAFGIPGAGVAGKAIGQGLARAAQREIPVLGKGAEFIGNQLRSFNPKLAQATNPAARAAAVNKDLLGRPTTGLSVNMPDQNSEYQMWLKAHEQQPQTIMPADMAPDEIPLHPFEDIQPAVEQYAPVDEQGQRGWQAIMDANMGKPAPELPPAPPTPVPFGAGREAMSPTPELNFAEQAPWANEWLGKGPEPVKPNIIQQAAGASVPEVPKPVVKPKGLKISEEELARRAQDPNYKTPAQLRAEKIAAEDAAAKAEQDLLDAEKPLEDPAMPLTDAGETLGGVQLDARDPRYYRNQPEVAAEIAKLDAEMQRVEALKKVDGTRGPKAEANAAKLRALQAAMDKVITPTARVKAGLVDKTGTIKPTALEDLKTIVKHTLGNERGSTGGGEIPKEVREATDRILGEHADRFAQFMKTPGATAAKYVAENFSDKQGATKAFLTREFQNNRPKIGNLYADKMSPEMGRLAKDNPEVVSRPVVKDAAVLSHVGSEEANMAAKDIADMDPEVVASAAKHTEQMAQHMLDMARGDAKTADKYRQEAVEYLRRLSKIRQTAGLNLRHAGMSGRNDDFLARLEAELNRGGFTADDAMVVREAIARGKRLKPSLMKMIDRGIQEYGINMMLYNTDTSMRNVIGGAIGTILNPIERAGNAVTTALARGAGIPEHKIRNATEMEEVIPSLVAGVKAVPRALRSGAKVFWHETPKGVAENYARQAKQLKRALPREEAKKAIAKLQEKKARYNEDFSTQEDLSSLGFRNTRNLSSDNPVLDTVGKVINFGGQSLKAMDLVNSQVIKEMETTAALIRKEVQAKRAGNVASGKLTPKEQQQIYDRVLHYTMRERLPAAVSSVYKGLNTNFVTGLLFPFMRAQITLPRFAINRTPAALGSIALNAGKTIAGKDTLDTMQITRAAMGTTAAVAGWLQLKKNGVEIHGAANTPEDRANRKANKIPQGIYLKFKDGTVKKVDDIAPVSYIFALYAAFDDAHRRAEEGQAIKDNQVQGALEAMSNVAQGSVFTGMRDMTYAGEQAYKEASDGGRSVYPGVNEGERLDRGAGEAWGNRKLASLTVPRVLGEAQRKGWGQDVSPEFRSPRDLGEEYKTAIGFGLEKQVPVQLDTFGQPAKRGENMDPLREIFGKGTEPAQDPAIQLFDKLGWYPTPPAKTLDGLRVTQDKRMESLRTFGPAVHQLATELENNPSFKSMPERQQREFLKSTVSSILSTGNVVTKAKMLQQLQRFSPQQKKDAQYNLKDKDSGILASWGLN